MVALFCRDIFFWDMYRDKKRDKVYYCTTPGPRNCSASQRSPCTLGGSRGALQDQPVWAWQGGWLPSAWTLWPVWLRDLALPDRVLHQGFGGQRPEARGDGERSPPEDWKDLWDFAIFEPSASWPFGCTCSAAPDWDAPSHESSVPCAAGDLGDSDHGWHLQVGGATDIDSAASLQVASNSHGGFQMEERGEEGQVVRLLLRSTLGAPRQPWPWSFWVAWLRQSIGGPGGDLHRSPEHPLIEAPCRDSGRVAADEISQWEPEAAGGADGGEVREVAARHFEVSGSVW